VEWWGIRPRRPIGFVSYDRPRRQIGFVLRICPSSPAPGASSLRRSGELALFCTLAPSPARRPPRCPILPRFGFVLPGPIECSIHHNSFPRTHLPFLVLRRELALFRTIGTSLGAPSPDVPSCPSLALFRTIGPDVPHPSGFVPPGLGRGWWNDRTVERWGISAAGHRLGAPLRAIGFVLRTLSSAGRRLGGPATTPSPIRNPQSSTWLPSAFKS
jgi:hypothetical protein